MHYQKYLMDAAGITKLPETFEELRKATIALNHPPERYGFGLNGRQGPAMFSSFSPWLYSAGGDTVDFKTGEILINKPEAVFALEFWTDFVRKDNVVPPEAMTWDFEEIVAGGQSGRYAIVETFAPYGTLINDPKLSKTGGKWVWDTVPGRTDKSQSKTWVDGHFLGVPKYTKNKEWSLEFIRMACGKEFMKRSMIRGNAPPRGSVLRDPEMVRLIGWTDVAARSDRNRRANPGAAGLSRLGVSLRAGLSQALIGEKTPKQALDDVAEDWRAHAPHGERAVIGRRVLLGSALAAPMVARAQAKPEKLVFVGDNGPWHWCLVEEVAPHFEKATGIKIDFTLLPIDALSARLKAELNSGTVGIDVIQWTAPFAGWLSPHLEDHEKLLPLGYPEFDWDDFLPSVREMASYKGKVLGIPYRVTASILNYQKQLLADAGIPRAPEQLGLNSWPPARPRPRRRSGTASAFGAVRDPPSWAAFPRSCAATAAIISIRKPGKS